ncbi:hypothetical protein GS426_15970 [Rhodococcus hoagii]|nr:hypothetical protein [Prescottella equi]
MQHSFATSGNPASVPCSRRRGLPGFDGDGQVDHGDRSGGRRLTTTTTLTVPPTAETGQQITLTANLDPSNAAGSVQFKDGATNIVDRWP